MKWYMAAIVAIGIFVAGIFSEYGFLSCSGKLARPVVARNPDTVRVPVPVAFDSAQVYVEGVEAGYKAAQGKAKWRGVTDTITKADPRVIAELALAYRLLDSVMTANGIDIVTRDIMRIRYGTVLMEYHKLGDNFRGSTFIETEQPAAPEPPKTETPVRRWGLGIHLGAGFSPFQSSKVAVPYIGLGVNYNVFTLPF